MARKDHAITVAIAFVRDRTGFNDPLSVKTIQPDGARQLFTLSARRAYFESLDEVPDPHEFVALVQIGEGEPAPVTFEEHDHALASHQDTNMHAAVVHILADAAVSVLVIVGLLLACSFGWLRMDPIVGLIGAGVIGSWAYGLVRDTGSILPDMNGQTRRTANV